MRTVLVILVGTSISIFLLISLYEKQSELTTPQVKSSLSKKKLESKANSSLFIDDRSHTETQNLGKKNDITNDTNKDDENADNRIKRFMENQVLKYSLNNALEKGEITKVEIDYISGQMDKLHSYDKQLEKMESIKELSLSDRKVIIDHIATILNSKMGITGYGDVSRVAIRLAEKLKAIELVDYIIKKIGSAALPIGSELILTRSFPELNVLIAFGEKNIELILLSVERNKDSINDRGLGLIQFALEEIYSQKKDTAKKIIENFANRQIDEDFKKRLHENILKSF